MSEAIDQTALAQAIETQKAIGSAVAANLSYLESLVVVAPPTPTPVTKIVTPFKSVLTRIPLTDIQIANPLIGGSFVDAERMWEAVAWQDNDDVQFVLRPDGKMEVWCTTPNGTFTYIQFCHADDRMDKFGDKCLHTSREMFYHLGTRTNNVTYYTTRDDTDLISTRYLTERICPFKPDCVGLAVAMCQDRWDVRAFENGVQVYQNDLDGYHFADTGFEGTPFRTSSHMIPSQPPYPPNPPQPEIRWHQYDNGQPNEYGLTHSIDHYLQVETRNGKEGTRIKIVENGFTKLNDWMPVKITSAHPMDSAGIYHLQNQLADQQAQESAGNGREDGYFLAGLRSLHIFGPLTQEILEVMP